MKTAAIVAFAAAAATAATAAGSVQPFTETFETNANWNNGDFQPLTEVDVDVSVGDYVLAIDGVELKGTDNPYRLLQHLDGTVVWTVSGTPSMEGSREIRDRPVRSESSLVYLGWVLGNLGRVTKMSEGRLGYLHVPNMGADGIAEFIKWFYPQIRREGLIVDVRGNGGGNVSSMIIV